MRPCTQSLGNYDGEFASYPAEALQNYNLFPSSFFVHSGFQFTWPNILTGQKNNVETTGQTIACNGANASALGMIGSAEQGASSGPLSIQYTDGTTQNATLAFPDSTDANPPAGTDTVAQGGRYKCNPSCVNETVIVSLYLISFPLDSSRLLQSITLSSNTHLHIFALGTPCNTR
ncbi:unnamed protein product [Didymodactylos carnosus]|uniref:Uncharacterized protein n=1 Tax=Didymodactylos carnosus TaxID=1234261 RepID=A0A814KP83_9BILA|nr:unnamed protein product [Didymodactylos carnosus]CAF3821692.1 unnamed protein product [Didymodactylos carnosus]